MTNNREDFFAEKLRKRKESGLYRKLEIPRAGSIDFYSNDYLGLASETVTIKDCLPGSTGSRLISGNYEAVERLETRLSAFFNFPAALLFHSGYLANLAIFAALAQKDDVVLYDSNVHASFKDAFRLSPASFYAYKHNDFEDLQTKLRKYTDKRIWVVSEAVFSMHGTVTDVKKLSGLCAQHHSFLILDEAHAFGVMGEKRKGLLSEYSDNVIKMVTFGKSLGAQGAVVLMSHTMKEYMLNFSRPFIYTTAVSPVLTELINIQLKRFEHTDEAFQLLNSNIRYFKEKATEQGLNISEGDSPIQMWYPKNKDWKQIKKKFEEANLSAKVILPPTVKEGEEAVRITLHSFNTFGEIDLLVGVMGAV